MNTTTYLVSYPTGLKVLPAGTIIKTVQDNKPIDEVNLGGLFSEVVSVQKVAQAVDEFTITSKDIEVKKLKGTEYPIVLCVCRKKEKYKEGEWVVCISRNVAVKLGEELPSGTGFIVDAPVFFVNVVDITEVVKSNFPYEGVELISGGEVEKIFTCLQRKYVMNPENQIKTTHNLDFLCVPWHRNPSFVSFKVGTCDGLYFTQDDMYVILAIHNEVEGNGHLDDVFEWFEHSCKRDNYRLVVAEVMNESFRKHLIEKRGFKPFEIKDSVVKTFLNC